MAVVTGQSFGNFQVVRLLGEGGFGEVYEAENPFLQRRAAVKVLHAGMVQDPELVRRFLNEARAASAIRHPNIIDVFDAGVTPDGEPYILMEFLAGDSLQKILLQQGKLDLATVQEIVDAARKTLGRADFNPGVEPRREGDPATLIADSTKAKETLGWAAEREVDKMIASAAAWHRSTIYVDTILKKANALSG